MFTTRHAVRGDEAIPPVQGSRRIGVHPARALVAAVLDDAVSILKRRDVGVSKAGKRLFEETVAWCAADDLEHPFSFLNACAALDLDADTLRRRLLAEPRGRSRWGTLPRRVIDAAAAGGRGS
ncbi:MAG: hypothetical protein KIT14_05140 [bacterium]|nr:hypothetical protein [bacterium]